MQQGVRRRVHHAQARSQLGDTHRCSIHPRGKARTGARPERAPSLAAAPGPLRLRSGAAALPPRRPTLRLMCRQTLGPTNRRWRFERCREGPALRSLRSLRVIFATLAWLAPRKRRLPAVLDVMLAADHDLGEGSRTFPSCNSLMVPVTRRCATRSSPLLWRSSLPALRGGEQASSPAPRAKAHLLAWPREWATRLLYHR